MKTVQALCALLCAIFAGIVCSPNAEAGAPFQPPVALTIQTNGTNAVDVSWPAAPSANYWLQASEDLLSPAAWYNSPWGMSNLAGVTVATVPMDVNARFFRLVGSPYLPPPAGLLAFADDSVIYVIWESVTNATSYNIYWASDPSVSPGSYSHLPNSGTMGGIIQPFAIFNNLVAGVTYYFVVTAVDANGESAPSNPGSALFSAEGQVHGSFFTQLVTGGETNDIAVAGVTAILSNATTVIQAISDGDGDFVASPVPAGTYQFCWLASGFGPGCSAAQVTVASNEVEVLDPQELFSPTNGPKTGTVYGDVSLLDGSIPVFNTDPFGNSLSTRITLMDSSNHIVGNAMVNESGQYFLAGVPMGSNFTLTATAEQASVSTNIDTTVTGLADLVLPISPPVIESVQAIYSGQPVTFAPTSATVQIQVQATDPQGYPLTYSWAAGVGGEGLIPANSPNVSLTMPSNAGPVWVSVEVGDGFGGYASSVFYMEAGTQEDFVGFVTAAGNPVTNASVTVNGSTATTDTNGMFSISLPEGLTSVPMSITAVGYVPFYSTVSDSDSGAVWCLTPVQTQCRSWTGGPDQFTDGNGTTLQLPGGSILSNGTNYYGQICVSIETFDPCSSFPAGYAAIDTNSQTNWLFPQATAFVNITDDSGNALQISPSQPATLTMTDGASCCTNATNNTEWIWDPTNMVWRIGGYFTPSSSGSSLIFYGPIFQFGILAIGAVPDNGGKTKVTVVPDRTLNFPFQLRVSWQAAPIDIGRPIGKDQPDFSAPKNANVTIDVINPKEAPGDYYTDPTSLASLRTLPNKTAILRVQTNFTTDTADLPLSLITAIPALARPTLQDQNPTEDSQFLTFRSEGTRVGNGTIDGDIYYTTVVPGWKINSTPFSAFLIRNGFVPPNGDKTKYQDDASAVYFNASDLGLARSMHMRLTPGIDGKTNVAYFVINYYTIDQALADNPTNGPPNFSGKAVATVCMDYRADVITNSTNGVVTNRFTKFFVFDPGFYGSLRGDADLDFGGGKDNPNVCVTCHGTKPINYGRTPTTSGPTPGFTISPASGNVQGGFIPFDLRSFTYTPLFKVQQASFFALNRGLYLYTPLTPAMKELIEGWYGGPLTATNTNSFNAYFVPSGWSGNADIYTNVVSISCRSCHTMRIMGSSGSSTNKDISFRSYAGMARFSDYQVCQGVTMPNAERTFSIFWGSMAANFIKNGVVPNQPLILSNAFSYGDTPRARRLP